MAYWTKGMQQPQANIKNKLQKAHRLTHEWPHEYDCHEEVHCPFHRYQSFKTKLQKWDSLREMRAAKTSHHRKPYPPLSLFK